MEGKFRNTYRINSARKPGHNYGMPGFYFITICTKNRICHFGNVVNSTMILSDMGHIVTDEWKKTVTIRTNVELDEWVIMPNHMHMIVRILENGYMSNDIVETPCKASLPRASQPTQSPSCNHTSQPYHNIFGPQRNNISSIICGFKATVTKRIHMELDQWNFAWQPRFHDHIIHDERALYNIRQYIINNPLNWKTDFYN